MKMKVVKLSDVEELQKLINKAIEGNKTDVFWDDEWHRLNYLIEIVNHLIDGQMYD